jgi:3',5'-cyclic AMP phosphodiesterase CpdA
VLIAQLTDTHITPPGKLANGVVDTAAYLARAVAEIEALQPRPDVVVLTGDLVDKGTPEEYAQLRALLAPLSMPLFAIPGNHDSREGMREAFAGDGYLPRAGYLNFALEDWPLRIIALDTLVPGEGGGALCGERLRWLAQTLAAAPDRASVILMHHPPFRTGFAAMDRIGLAGGAALAEIVRAHPSVERILCGHLHRAIDCRFAGTIAGTAPSTAHQLLLDLQPSTPASYFVMEPPGYQLHRWEEEDGLVTHTAVVGAYPGPYPFAHSE